jgi:hypothetical protein
MNIHLKNRTIFRDSPEYDQHLVCHILNIKSFLFRIKNCGIPFPENDQTISGIQVFQTNISKPKDLERVSAYIACDQRILDWNVDLGDVDKVLRLETSNMRPSEVIKLIRQAGYFCHILPD